MKQFFKIASLFLLLGFILLPKNYSSAPILNDICCSSTSSDSCEKNSKKKEDPCHSHDKKESNKDCQDCNSCASIGFFLTIETEPILDERSVNIGSSQNTCTYLSPEFSDFASKS